MRPRALYVLGLAAVAACGGGRAAGPAPQPVATRSAPASAAVVVPPPRADGRLPAGARPLAYDLSLRVDPAKDGFSGTARIRVALDKPTRVVVLHARGMRVTRARAVAGSGAIVATASSRAAAGGKEQPEELVLVFERELPAGEATLELMYEAPFGDGLRGLYKVHEGGADYAYTQFEPTDARRAFPCFDEPGFKLPFRLELTVPRGDRALANMPAEKTTDNADGTTTVRFAESPPLPSYLVAFGVGPFDVVEGEAKPVPFRVVTVRGKGKLGKLALDTAPQLIHQLAAYFDTPYPYPKLDIVAVPEFAAGAMENPGFVTFREELLLLDPAHASIAARRRQAEVMAHEFAHQWFGDLVTMSWWNDIWLNEAFASWMGAKTVDAWHPGFGAHLEAVHWKSWAMNLDALDSARRIRQPVHNTSEALESFDAITYDKGMSVLGMVESWLGPETFRAGVRQYVHAHSWKNATADDLFAALGAASGKDVASVMDTFLDQSGVPLVSATRVCAPGSPAGQIQLAQSEYRPLGSAPRKTPRSWRIPVCVRVAVQGTPKTACTLLDQATGKIPVNGCPRFFYPDAGEQGYYRVDLPDATLAALFAAGTRQLDEAELAGLVSDGWALVRAGRLGAGQYLASLEKLSGEHSRAVQGEVLEALDDVDGALVADAARPDFARYVERVVGPTSHRLGFKPKPGESDDDALLRRDALDTMGRLADDAWTRRQAASVAKAWFADASRVDADVAAVAVAIDARHGDAALFDRLLDKLAHAPTPEQRLIALGGLVAFDDASLVERLLALTLDGSIKTQDLRYVYPPLFARHETRDVAYRWIRGHLEAVEKRLPSFIVGRLVWVVAGLCDAGRVDDAQAFFAPKVAEIEGADKNLKQAVEAGKLCAALADNQRPAVTAWLGGKKK